MITVLIPMPLPACNTIPPCLIPNFSELGEDSTRKQRLKNESHGIASCLRLFYGPFPMLPVSLSLFGCEVWDAGYVPMAGAVADQSL